MHILAILGSLRQASNNTALRQALADLAPHPLHIALFGGLATLPPINPDHAAMLTAFSNEFADFIGRSR